MLEPIPGYDAWKTMSPESIEYDPQPRDLCVCGHAYRDHHGAAQSCWKCAEEEWMCDEFAPDFETMAADARAEAEEAEVDSALDK